jgi:3-oxoacyl-[acyl-carrier-protein] synthase II
MQMNRELRARQPMSRIAITGIGILAPGAIGLDAFRTLLRSGNTAIAPVDRFDTEGLASHQAALVHGFQARDFIAPMKLRRMNTLSRYALAAAKMALDDSGLEAGRREGAGVAIGTMFGPVQTSVEYMREYVEKGASLAPPQLFAESVANAPGSHVAIEFGLRGFNLTFTQRESSALAAATFAASQIVKGSLEAALIGGVEEINEMVFSVLGRLGALAHETANSVEASRPFDRRRNGMVLGEGSAILVAESADSANRRGARVHAYLSGFGIGRDTSASISDWGTGSAKIASVMRAAIDDAELEVGDIGAVWASANSTKRGDAVEAEALRALFGSNMPPVVATKGYFGEYAAGGAIHLAAAVMAMADQELPLSCGCETPDSGVSPTQERLQLPIRHMLVNSVSSGGGVVCAVLSRSVDE